MKGWFGITQNVTKIGINSEFYDIIFFKPDPFFIHVLFLSALNFQLSTICRRQIF